MVNYVIQQKHISTGDKRNVPIKEKLKHLYCILYIVYCIFIVITLKQPESYRSYNFRYVDVHTDRWTYVCLDICMGLLSVWNRSGLTIKVI